jgi:peptide/nickel transport system substrate-binding protein
MKKNVFLTTLFALMLLVLGACQPSAPATEAPEATDVMTEEVEATEAMTEEPMAETEEPVATEEMAATEEPVATEEPAASEPLIVLIDNDEGPITPANANTFGGYMTGWIYDQLYIRTPDLGTIPHLATDATPSEDGLTWTITLRDDVKWHDGEPFTAEDVVFSYTFLTEAGRAPAFLRKPLLRCTSCLNTSGEIKFQSVAS